MIITTQPILVNSKREFMFVIEKDGQYFEGKLIESFVLDTNDYKFFLKWAGKEPQLTLAENRILFNKLIDDTKIDFNSVTIT